jgi:hypothetical protein
MSSTTLRDQLKAGTASARANIIAAGCEPGKTNILALAITARSTNLVPSLRGQPH